MLMLFCSAQLILEGITIYGWLVRIRGNEAALNNEPKVFEASMAGTAIIAFTVEIVYAVRIWRLSNHNLWLTGVVVILALLGFGGGIAMVATIAEHPFWSEANTNFIPSTISLAGTVSCDVAIAAIQVYLFRQHLKSNKHGQLQGMLGKLSKMVISVGLLTTVDAIVFLTTFLVNPANGVFIIPYLLLCNCYLNSFLSLINQRTDLRKTADEHELSTFSRRLTTLRFREITTSEFTSATEVETEVES